MTAPPLDEAYWKNLKIQAEDLEALSAYLLEVETPLSPAELAGHLVAERLRREAEAAAKQESPAETYLPKNSYKAEQRLSFPALDGAVGVVRAVRAANRLNGESFDVIEVEFEDGHTEEFASGLAEHRLNAPPEEPEEEGPDPAEVMAVHGKALAEKLEKALRENSDFVYIAGRWFPKALIIDVSEGQLNVAEALLDMAGGGPLPPEELLGEVDLPDGVNPKLASFSLDLALQEDERFDEVGSTGLVRWFLHRLEPEDVRKTPIPLRYQEIEHDRTGLTQEMLALERQLDDELSPIEADDDSPVEEVEVRLIFPHWRAGTIPLTENLARFFPTAYESPRVQFEFVDGESGARFPGWVVRFERYVQGLRDWYRQKGLMPGSYVRARRGEKPGEIIVEADAHRASKEWVRTALIGADGAVVYALLKQTVETSFDERMMVFMPSETQALDAAWTKRAEKPLSLPKVVLWLLEELAKLNPQNHVHASEIYSAVNVVMRCPPAPILAMLATHADVEHVGDLHYRIKGSASE